MPYSKLTDEQIIEAINKSGYLMEQEIASRVQNLGYHVRTNRAFEDQEQDKSREIDVWASKNFCKTEGLVGVAEIICEAKNNESPFVFIAREKNEYDHYYSPNEFLFPQTKVKNVISKKGERETYRMEPVFNYLDIRDKHYYYGQNIKCVQFCELKWDKKKIVATHGRSYDSIIYPIVKCLKSMQDSVKDIVKNNHIFLFFNIVVLNSDIYLIDSSQEEPKPIKSPYLSFVRELQTKDIEGTFQIDFVQRSYIEEFFNECIEPFLQTMSQAIQQKSHLLKK